MEYCKSDERFKIQNEDQEDKICNDICLPRECFLTDWP